MGKVSIYTVLREKKAKLRLYLNDPKIKEFIKNQDFPIPLVLEGKMVVARKNKQMHIFFLHKNPDFIPVFIDYKGELENE